MKYFEVASNLERADNEVDSHAHGVTYIQIEFVINRSIACSGPVPAILKPPAR